MNDNLENIGNDDLPKPKKHLLKCIRKVDDFKVGEVYNAEETIFSTSLEMQIPDLWKAYKETKRDVSEFYDTYKVFLVDNGSSRGFSKSVVSNFFEDVTN